jgi:hypothetical protein
MPQLAAKESLFASGLPQCSVTIDVRRCLAGSRFQPIKRGTGKGICEIALLYRSGHTRTNMRYAGKSFSSLSDHILRASESDNLPNHECHFGCSLISKRKLSTHVCEVASLDMLLHPFQVRASPEVEAASALRCRSTKSRNRKKLCHGIGEPCSHSIKSRIC